jgi:hypothetical protein
MRDDHAGRRSVHDGSHPVLELLSPDICSATPRPTAIPAAPSPGALRARPGDRREGWSACEPSLVAEVADSAAGRRIDVPTALSMVIERRLILLELGSAQADAIGVALDQAAGKTSVRKELSQPSSAYLRGLLHGMDGDLPSGPPRRSIAFPARLGDRLSSVWPPDPALTRPEFESALSWEVAAVTTGFTMSEWAFYVHASPAFPT